MTQDKVENLSGKRSGPNVLFIITDQQRADNNGFMGNEVLRTPNLDQIASEGTVFENAWVSNPVCMPNRIDDYDWAYADGSRGDF